MLPSSYKHIRYIYSEFTGHDEGASSVEYAVLISLIIAVCIAVILVIGTKTNTLYEFLNTSFS